MNEIEAESAKTINGPSPEIRITICASGFQCSWVDSNDSLNRLLDFASKLIIEAQNRKSAINIAQ